MKLYAKGLNMSIGRSFKLVKKVTCKPPTHGAIESDPTLDLRWALKWTVDRSF